MLATTPIYSVVHECQDCCKCIRQCPVKAIRVVDGHARVIPEACIVCGHCVESCPSGAKRVRDDVGRAKDLLRRHARVLVSLAPSFVTEFPDLDPRRLVAACRLLGFAGVSETALGAQQVSALLGQQLEAAQGQLFMSSACPVAVSYVQQQFPHLAGHVTPLLSPMLAHGKLLRALYGEDVGIVFVGPCIAKKVEVEQHPALMDAALTFADLRRWFQAAGIDPATVEPCAEGFVPQAAEEGAIYPIDGGMNDVTRANCRDKSTRFVSVSGLGPIAAALDGLEPAGLSDNLCLELLACAGGCINGPGTGARSPIAARLRIQDRAVFPATLPRAVEVDLLATYSAPPQEAPDPDEAALREVLLRIGKPTRHEELNCGGCGYDGCREFAAAMLEGKAETSMCVSYMRQLAQKKVNVLFRTMPYGVVIVDDALTIVECNERFAEIVGNDAPTVYAACPGMEGADLTRLLPGTELFRQVLATQEEIIRRTVRMGDRLLSISVFNVEPHRMVGAILLDVTQTEARRQEIVAKASLVIQNTLANAQEIAFLMGKNAAESECILNSVIEGFLPLPEAEA